MKTFLPFLAIAALVLGSCSPVKVISDYDKEVTFVEYKTYAFYKTGIDQAQISDLDKRRILRAIDEELQAKGFVKSETPDMLVSIFTKERERVDVYNNNFGWGWGWQGFWNPWFWGPAAGQNVSVSTEGALFIDLIDAKNKKLIWQGRGSGPLVSAKNVEKKEKRIGQFVTEILEEYPPASK